MKPGDVLLSPGPPLSFLLITDSFMPSDEAHSPSRPLLGQELSPLFFY